MVPVIYFIHSEKDRPEIAPHHSDDRLHDRFRELQGSGRGDVQHRHRLFIRRAVLRPRKADRQRTYGKEKRLLGVSHDLAADTRGRFLLP